MTTDEKDFLARWSRRKQSAREGLVEPEAQSQDLPAEAEDAQAPVPQTKESTHEDAFADVDFDALDYGSDYTRFMGKDVPEIVQRRALRALWRSDPVLANIDGLNDYDEDFTDAATVIGNLVSSYRAGYGYRSDEEIAALEEERKAEAEARAAAQSGESETAESFAQDAGDGGEAPETAEAEAASGEAPETAAADAQAEDVDQAAEPTSRT